MASDDEIDKHVIELDDRLVSSRRRIDRIRRLILVVYGFFAVIFVFALPGMFQSGLSFQDLLMVLPFAGIFYAKRLQHRRLEDLKILTAIIVIHSGWGLYNDAVAIATFERLDREELQKEMIAHNEAHPERPRPMNPDHVPENLVVYQVGGIAFIIVLDLLPLAGVTLLNRRYREEFT